MDSCNVLYYYHYSKQPLCVLSYWIQFMSYIIIICSSFVSCYLLLVSEYNSYFLCRFKHQLWKLQLLNFSFLHFCINLFFFFFFFFIYFLPFFYFYCYLFIHLFIFIFVDLNISYEDFSFEIHNADLITSMSQNTGE